MVTHWQEERMLPATEISWLLRKLAKILISGDLFFFSFFLYFFQNWFAFTGNGSQFNFTRSGEVNFPNSGNPTADDNYGFCQVCLSVIDNNQLSLMFNKMGRPGCVSHYLLYCHYYFFQTLKNYRHPLTTTEDVNRSTKTKTYFHDIFPLIFYFFYRKCSITPHFMNLQLFLFLFIIIMTVKSRVMFHQKTTLLPPGWR